MAESSNIAWTDATWNCIVGCSHVSPGCENCYAETLALRWGWSKKPWKAQNAAENVVLKPEKIELPLTWKNPKRVFVNSLSDCFHELVPVDFLDRMFDVMEQCPQHTFQILTKRPERMRQYMNERVFGHDRYETRGTVTTTTQMLNVVRPNIWLGVSVEDQRRADERIPVLLDTPAAVRFLSCEPLLGALDLHEGLWFPTFDGIFNRLLADEGAGWATPQRGHIHWVIVGGESGPRHRAMDLDWARSIQRQCEETGTAFFFKQTSGPRPGMGEDALGGVWNQFPAGNGGITEAART